MPLSAAERQRRCREKRLNQPEKNIEVKRKDLEQYHARKRLVKDMTTEEHRLMKRKWQIRNKRNVLLNTPDSTPPPASPMILPVSSQSRESTPAPSIASARRRKQVRRDRSKLYRENVQHSSNWCFSY